MAIHSCMDLVRGKNYFFWVPPKMGKFSGEFRGGPYFIPNSKVINGNIVQNAKRNFFDSCPPNSCPPFWGLSGKPLKGSASHPRKYRHRVQRTQIRWTTFLVGCCFIQLILKKNVPSLKVKSWNVHFKYFRAVKSRPNVWQNPPYFCHTMFFCLSPLTGTHFRSFGGFPYKNSKK